MNLFLIFIYFRLVTVMVYYGIIYNVENLGGNMYLNFSLLGTVGVPAYILNVFLVDRIGRRYLLISSLWVTGVACLISGFIPKSGPTLFQ